MKLHTRVPSQIIKMNEELQEKFEFDKPLNVRYHSFIRRTLRDFCRELTPFININENIIIVNPLFFKGNSAFICFIPFYIMPFKGGRYEVYSEYDKICTVDFDRAAQPVEGVQGYSVTFHSIEGHEDFKPTMGDTSIFKEEDQ